MGHNGSSTGDSPVDVAGEIWLVFLSCATLAHGLHSVVM